MFLIVILYALLASTFTISKAVLFYAKPIFTIGVRMIIAGSLLLLAQFFTHKNRLKIEKKDLFLFLKVAFFHIYFSFILEFVALQKMTASKVTLIFSITPFVAAIFSYFLLGEKLAKKKIMGMVLGFIGLFPVLILQGAGSEGASFLSFSWREMILLCAVVSANYAWFPIKELMNKGYSLILINGFAMLVGGVGAFITSGIFEGFSPSPVYSFQPFILWLLLLIFVSNVIFYNLYGYLLKHYSITFLTFVGFLSPIFGAFFGYIFLKENITWHYIASLCIIAVALYIFTQSDKKKVKQ